MVFVVDFRLFLSKTSMIILVATVVYMTYLYLNVKKRLSVWKKKGIKYIKPKFLFGITQRKRNKALVENQQEMYNLFPDERYIGMYRLLQPTLIIKDPDLIKQITVKEFDHFVDHRSVLAADSDPLWSKNLLASQGDRWRDLRSTLSPSFTSRKMKIIYSLIEECTQQFIDFYKTDPSVVIELEMKDTFRRFTNDVIATVAFGIKCDSLKNRNNEFYMMGIEATDLRRGRILKGLVSSFSPFLSKLLKIRLIPEHVANYFSHIIKNTVKSREENQIVRPDMIHLLMEAKKGGKQQEEELANYKNRRKREITIDDLVAQAFIFFFAGFETVSTVLTFATYELAINPDIQTRLRREIKQVDKLTYESLLSMKYLDMVVSEALRKWPGAIFTDRNVTKPFTIQPVRPGEKPLHLEKGLNCLIPIFSLHRDSQLYPDPEKFDPERFSDENKHKIHPFGYIPFGAGPRNCIGSRLALLESKLMMATLLKNFEIVPVARTPVNMVLDKNQINLTAEGGMWLGLKKIN